MIVYRVIQYDDNGNMIDFNPRMRIKDELVKLRKGK